MECPEWVEGVWEPGDKGMSMLALGARVSLPVKARPLAASVKVRPPPARHMPARSGRGGGGVCGGLIMGAPPITARGRR